MTCAFAFFSHKLLTVLLNLFANNFCYPCSFHTLQNKGPANGGERNEREDRNGRDRDRGSSETRSKPPADSRR